VAVVAAGALIVASGRLPIRSMMTFLQFKFSPEKARIQHLLRLRNASTEQVVYLLGTTHQYHYEDDAYSIWHVKAAITGLRPEALFLEMMADAVDGGRLGEGPPEMPFLATLARDERLRLFGVDAGWDGGWQGRQARMFAQVEQHLPKVRSALIAAGFMHVQQFREQLEGVGFVVEPWSDAEKVAIMDEPVAKVLPSGFRAAVVDAVARARRGDFATDPRRRADVAWFIEVREKILARLEGVPDAPPP
jgi:hypothetical protein